MQTPYVPFIVFTKVGDFPPFGYQNGEGIFSTWKAARKAAIKHFSDPKVNHCLLCDIDGNSQKVERENPIIIYLKTVLKNFKWWFKR